MESYKLDKDDKWDVEKHSMEVSKSHPFIFIIISFLINGFSLYKLNEAYQKDEIKLLNIGFISILMYCIIDLLSGLLHIVLDNPNYIKNKIIGKLALGFQQHHFNTTLIVKMKLIDHLRPMCVPIILVTILGFIIHGFNNPSLYIYIISFSLGICWMQCCHRWSHMNLQQRGNIVVFLQKIGIALCPSVHLNHHVSPYLNNFCIMNGMFNPLINYISSSSDYFHPHKYIWAPIFIISVLLSVILIPLL